MKHIAIALMGLLFSGCSGGDGDRFDRLKLVDGNGDIYILKHNFGDAYFVDNLSEMDREGRALPNAEINKKLEAKQQKRE